MNALNHYFDDDKNPMSSTMIIIIQKMMMMIEILTTVIAAPATSTIRLPVAAIIIVHSFGTHSHSLRIQDQRYFDFDQMFV